MGIKVEPKELGWAGWTVPGQCLGKGMAVRTEERRRTGMARLYSPNQREVAAAYWHDLSPVSFSFLEREEAGVRWHGIAVVG